MTNSVDPSKRRFLTKATTVVGGVGAAIATIPFLASMFPSERAQAAGAPIEVDISKLKIGQLIKAEWRGKPVWIVRRSQQAIDTLLAETARLSDPYSKVDEQQPNYCQNPLRSLREDIIVLVGICTHLGCSPTFRPEIGPSDLGPDWQGGYFCPCHGSRFDLAGRVYKSMPAPTNLVVPPYYFVDDNRIVIGEHMEGTA